MSARVDKALGKFNVAAVKKYREEHVVSLMEARRKMIDLAITEALECAHGWEDLLAIMKFQHTYKGYTL
jgi:hypothetical protein